MKTLAAFTLVGSILALGYHAVTPAQTGDFSGIIERVWEDGFELQTRDRTWIVDSWEVCGDHTASHVSVGDSVVVTGELDEGELDAFAIVTDTGATVCGS
jgi:hypothetical protein